MAFFCICAFSLGNIDKSQHDERVATSNVLMSKMGHHVKSTLDLDWSRAHYMAKRISSASYDSLDEVTEAIRSREQDFQPDSYDELLLVDGRGEAHASDGSVFRWMDASTLLEEGDAMFIADERYITEGGQRIHLLTPLPEPFQVEGVDFTHLSLVLPMSEFDDCFDVESYGEGSVAFILRANGSPVYRQEHNNAFAGVYNVFSALASADFHYGASMDKLYEDIAQGLNDTITLTYKGVRYSASYYPLGINDWVALLLVPENHAVADVALFTRSIVVNVVLIFAAAAIALIGVSYASLKRIRIKQNQVNEQLKKAAEAERAANEAKTAFLSSMSHDIRTPMNTIVGMTDLALRRFDDAAYVNECLRRINLASNHLLMLINDILDISKVESGKMVLSEEAFSIHEMVEGLSNIAQPLAKEKGVAFHIDAQHLDHEFLLGDKLRLNQVFINLLSNAVKFTPSGGRVNARMSERLLSEPANTVRLVFVVDDDGIGMSEEFQQSMYEVFAREEDGRTNSVVGSGLGLAICKQMVDLMGGAISCVSAEGEGSTFTVEIDLPLSERKTQEAEGGYQEVDLSGMRLLVAEDNEMNWMVLEAILDMSGIAADLAEDGQVCLDMLNAAEDGAYDAVLMDVRMPVMGGCEATRALRQSPKEWIRRIPVVAQTADAYAEDIQECMDAGMNYHVSKPIDTGKLIAILSEIRKGTLAFSPSCHSEERKRRGIQPGGQDPSLRA